MATLVRRQRWMVATAFLTLDAFVLLAYVAHLVVDDGARATSGEFAQRRWNGDRDGSVVELVGQVQLLLTVVTLLFVAWARRVAVHAVWALVLATALLDDLLRLHERGGQWLRSQWAVPEVGGLRAQDVGELATWGVLGLALGPALVAAHLMASSPDRRDSLVLLSLMALLAVFAVGVDMVKVALTGVISMLGVTGLTLLETAGELVPLALRLMAAHAASLVGVPGAARESVRRDPTSAELIEISPARAAVESARASQAGRDR